MMAVSAPSLPQADVAPPSPGNRRVRLLYFITEDWYFCSHRLPLAIAARDNGYDVGVITRVRDHGALIREAGLRLIPFEMSRRGRNPFQELAHVAALTQIYRHERPDIVHHVAMKPVIYGTIAARRAGAPHVVNALAGLGYAFTSSDLRARIMRPVIRHALARLLRESSVIIQNDTDRDFVADIGVPADRTHVVRGSGVDLNWFRPQPEPPVTPLVILPARLLRDKGILEFVGAARLLKARGVTARFALVGDPDPENPASVAESEIARWREEGIVELWGKRDDMPEVFAQCHLVCLPSYREGLPKVLLEAAASGRAIVTTNVPGCRDVVKDGANGLLVEARDVHGLAVAIATLIRDRALREKMGTRGRKMAEKSFSVARIVQETLAVYPQSSRP